MTLHDGWVSANNEDKLFLTKSPNPFAELQPQTCTELPPCLTVACIHSYRADCSVNTLPVLQPNIFKFWPQLQQRLPLFCTRVPMFSCIAELLVMLFGCNSSIKTTSGQTLNGFICVRVISASSELMALENNIEVLFIHTYIYIYCIYTEKLTDRKDWKRMNIYWPLLGPTGNV